MSLLSIERTRRRRSRRTAKIALAAKLPTAEKPPARGPLFAYQLKTLGWQKSTHVKLGFGLLKQPKKILFFC
jgi:hypothetical protein